MTSTAPPPDEILYRRPEIIQWWVSQGGRPMDENMIHRYFSESQFFDWQSKNGLIFNQAKTNEPQWYKTCNRKAFEDEIRSRTGLEYLIVREPQPVADKQLAAQGATTGVWVIRKQNRALKDTRDNRSLLSTSPSIIIERHPNASHYWELTVLGTYFIVGENVYQAPSVFDVVGNRLLSTAASLNAVSDTADALPRYSPAIGHHYLSRTGKSNTMSSAIGTPGPGQSREASLAPGDDSQSLRSGPASQDPSNAGTSASVHANDSRLLADSLMLTLQHGDEYTDENPLLGEPGSLRFTVSTAAVKKRRADEEAAAFKAQAEKESALTSRAASPKPEEAAPTPPDVFSQAKTTKPAKASKDERRGSKLEKKNRRKSRPHVGSTATSPSAMRSAPSPLASNSALS